MTLKYLKLFEYFKLYSAEIPKKETVWVTKAGHIFMTDSLKYVPAFHFHCTQTEVICAGLPVGDGVILF